MVFKNSLLIFIITLLYSSLYPAFAYQQQSGTKITLDWKTPWIADESESTFFSAIVFAGALYADSMPGIPIQKHRFPVPLSGYTYKVSLDNIIVQKTSLEESTILQENEFLAPDFPVSGYSEITRGEEWYVYSIIPFRKSSEGFEKMISYEIRTELVFDETFSLKSRHSYPENSVLATGQWARVCVDEDGIYRIGRQELAELGFSPAQIQKSTIRIFGNESGMLPESNSMPMATDLVEQSIWVSGNNTGTFGNDDFILFFGQSPHRWKYNASSDIFEHTVHLYSNETCYFITHSQQPGKRIETRESSSLTPTVTITDFYDYAYHQRDLVNLLGSGKMWFGELFDVTLSRNFEFSFPNALQTPARINFYVAARSSATSSFTIESGSVSQSFGIAGVNVSNQTGIFARHTTGTISALPQGDKINVKLTFNRSAAGSRGWLNYITVNSRRRLIRTGNQMFFRNPSATNQGAVARYEVSGMTGQHQIWDVTNPFNIFSQQLQQSGNSATFVVSNDILREFVVFDNQQFLRPRLRGAVPNQNLHALEVHDLIIVVPDLFRSEAERLAKFRREFDGLNVALVSPQQIYNEFSSGVPEISAIRNFMKMFYDRAAGTQEFPRYLLLFGNGTYDNKNVMGQGGNLIPTFQTLQSLSPATSYISDDFFGLLDDNEGSDAFGAIDLGIGRLPVRTVDEARFVVDKILRYNQRIEGLVPGTEDPRFAGLIPNYADWRNLITIIADDEDGNIHLEQSESIAGYLAANHPKFNIEKIYIDAYQQYTLAGGARYPDVNRAINNRVNQGALLVNYIGHGGTLGLAQERILTFEDILSWGNFYNLPVFMTATCEFSSFDQPDANELSAGVRVFLKPNGGAAALFTTTRLAYSHSNFTLNDAFIRNAFVPMENGEMPRLGDLIRIAKIRSSSASTLKNFVLLGDPSMQMAYPRYRAITTEVPDTIRALDQVTIKGQIHTPSGTLASSYNGVIYPTIYDKSSTFTTLANDPGSNRREFQMQNRIIFRGAATIENGEFEFSFIVPRDISYTSGRGKISYYFDDGIHSDGSGYFNGFVVSGTSETFQIDSQGPEIELFINNMDFVSGGKTGPDPILIAMITDESGINTTGQIGHDILAILNEDSSNPIILNNFYQSVPNTFQSGRVVYPFFNLEKGDYTLTFRAWDVHNNVGIASIDFVVTSAPGIELTRLVNFPNPFSDHTQFSIQHNKPASELAIKIEIFSLSGQMVKMIEQNVYASGFDVPPIEWDGRDDGGTPLNDGIYLFRVAVSAADGSSVQQTERLMIFRQ